MVVIIGAGIAGLTCAKYLKDRGIDSVLVEASDAVGGRVRTDIVDGFRLDRGFQVFLTSYPEAQDLLCYPELQLKSFQSGALIRKSGQFFTMPNPLKNLLTAPQALMAPVGSLADKLNLLRLTQQVKHRSNQVLLEETKEMSTLDFLQDFGYSETVIANFFRPFFGGVFLDPNLQTSAQLFQFLFKQFAQGDAVLPARGMQAISEQIASYLPLQSIRLQTRVIGIENHKVYLSGGESLDADVVVVATDAFAAATLLRQPIATAFHATDCVYFSADASPVTKPMLTINADADGIVNHVAVLSDVAKGYAPIGKSLISATIIGQADLPETAVATAVKNELVRWFGIQVHAWKHLRTYRIPQALPQYPAIKPAPVSTQLSESIYRCGDYLAYPSLNGAMQSGREVAEQIAQRIQKKRSYSDT